MLGFVDRQWSAPRARKEADQLATAASGHGVGDVVADAKAPSLVIGLRAAPFLSSWHRIDRDPQARADLVRARLDVVQGEAKGKDVERLWIEKARRIAVCIALPPIRGEADRFGSAFAAPGMEASVPGPLSGHSRQHFVDQGLESFSFLLSPPAPG